jgi:hypothetical protein
VLEACSRHLLDKTSPRNGSTTPPENRPIEKSYFNIEFFNTIGRERPDRRLSQFDPI